MAAAQMSSDLPKPSFAKVAASVSKESATHQSARRTVPPSKDQWSGPNASSTSTRPVIANGGPGRTPQTQNTPSVPVAVHSTPSRSGDGADAVLSSLHDLKLDVNAPNVVLNGSDDVPAGSSRPVASRESGSDESQKADSSSDLGTKPPSIDGKSITSGTTFALDEKESLRPDDSASVKAAADDDDAFSIRGSLIAGSRVGSELANRARYIQLGDMPERRLVQVSPGPLAQGAATPQSSSLEQPPGAAATIPLANVGASSDALNVIYRQAPDEKLLEALASPRDRLFLLRLEKDVIEFVQDSKEPYMDLPPSNSFCRMLTHKLADYYHMTHSYEPHIGSVRIFRTPFCRVPPSLALMSPQAETVAATPPPPPTLPKKIMRRGQDGAGGLASAGASKPASEDGSDGKDGKEKTPATNQKLTREEREEMYKLARERIFGNTDENVAENDENGMSRASSQSANKSNTGKRGKTSKQRRDDSDSFDSRTQYTPYWGPQQPTWVPQPQAPYGPPANNQFNGQPGLGYPSQMAPTYGQQPATYSNAPSMMPNTACQTYPLPSYPPQPGPPRYQPGGSPMTSYGTPVTTVSQQSWPQPGVSPVAYAPRGPASAGPVNGAGIPYAFGQLPANANPNDPKSQHPIPGSYNRNHAFNPKTQSFIPGGNVMSPSQASPAPFTPGSHHGSPQIGTPHLAYPAYQQGVPQPYGGGYGMARQGSNHSGPVYHAPQLMTPPHGQYIPPMQNPGHGPMQHTAQGSPAHVPVRPNMPGGSSQMFHHLPAYGNPATLPQKPAAGI